MSALRLPLAPIRSRPTANCRLPLDQCREPQADSRRPTPGFTIVELLIVVAVIALLMALVVVSLHGVQNLTARTNSINSLRQMVTGYLGYAGDNRNRLMPGYVEFPALPNDLTNPDNASNLLLNMRFKSGSWMVQQNAPAADRANLSSYVWRLVPYVDHNWQTMMTDYRDPGVMNFFVNQVGQYDVDSIYGPADVPNVGPDKAIPTIASAPAYGLNSIFLGGDNFHGGPSVVSRNPWQTANQKIAATRVSEAVNQRAIVFAPAALVNASWLEADADSPVYIRPDGFPQARGYPELRPPLVEKDSDGVWTNRQWRVARRGQIWPMSPVADPEAYEKGAGLPIMRRGSGVLPVARLDGSAEAEDIHVLSTDMRHWSPFETGLLPPAFSN